MTKGWIIGLDIGGTFTDAVMVHSNTNAFRRFKCLTTPDEPAVGALEAVEGLLKEAGADPSDVSIVLHATTLVSNALIERKGAKTAFITTKGFGDVLRIAREKKFDIYDLHLKRPVPLVSPELTFEIDERIAPDGSVLRPIDSASAENVIEAVRASGATAVAVCLLHSYMNSQHERALRDLLGERLPGVHVSLSSEVLPEIREYERASTTVANAYVQPVIATYLDQFVRGLHDRGLRSALFVMLSEGGLAAPELVRRLAVRICESGPAAGAVTAATVASQSRISRVLSFDMGGTTAKSALIHDGAPEVTMDFEVARTYRFKKGSGLPLRMPVVDLIEIGAGGGSIVRIDELGLIKVGPESAAADPGPACYGRGGSEPTVTDADLLLGYIGESSFLGGRMKLDRDAARGVIEGGVAKPLGISVEEAALRIHEIVNENMASASRVQAVERGFDPSSYSLVGFGGAGPVHAFGVAQKLKLKCFIIPPSAGVGSAVGLLLAPRTLHVSRTYIGILDELHWGRVHALFEEMSKEATEALKNAGVPSAKMRFVKTVDMRYRGQRKELTIGLANVARKLSADVLRVEFERKYRDVYHRIHDGHPIEALAWRLAASGPPITTSMGAGASQSAGHNGRGSKRKMLFAGWRGYRDCPVYSRYELSGRRAILGPAVIEEDESTSVIGPGARATVDRDRNILVRMQPLGGR
jgi:N-methylhydantoinase A